MTTQFTFEQPPQALFSIDTNSIDRAQNSIHFHSGTDTMLSISADGFYVRGVKIEQDEHEAKKVHESFKQWLVWAQLQRTA